MSRFVDAVAVEVLKLKGSLTALMTLLGPLSVVVFAVLLLSNQGNDTLAETGWQRFMQGAIAIWAYLVFPLLVALQAASINQIDHAVDGWKRMFSLPIKATHLFFAKLLILLAVMLASNVFLALGLIGVSGVWGQLATEIPSLTPEVAALAFQSLMACVCGGSLMIAMHFLLSWSMSSFVVPLTVGVVATMTIVQVGSSQYWVWNPWTWGMTAALSAEASRSLLAVVLGFGLGLLASVVGALMARRLRGYG